eukprot:CAMPEP_0194299740 /NCGR_PEP_ID=MMETSP0169-20130528/60879_1 /TAXON_ID=218684 /ORGANISM="Corethron pennatum, Strain L29A3" /LENGTH=253 /DNA_ID=CAMNT_0039049849 /DNA_START=57 /DNA_END=815 /DNA_ORIENTATION=+
MAGSRSRSKSARGVSRTEYAPVAPADDHHHPHAEHHPHHAERPPKFESVRGGRNDLFLPNSLRKKEIPVAPAVLLDAALVAAPPTFKSVRGGRNDLFLPASLRKAEVPVAPAVVLDDGDAGAYDVEMSASSKKFESVRGGRHDLFLPASLRTRDAPVAPATLIDDDEDDVGLVEAAPPAPHGVLRKNRRTKYAALIDEDDVEAASPTFKSVRGGRNDLFLPASLRKKDVPVAPAALLDDDDDDGGDVVVAPAP